MYNNSKNSGFDLPKEVGFYSGTKSVKALLGVFAAVFISGCVSQQSALDFNGSQVSQPVPSGVSLAGTNNNTNSDSGLASNNIPTKAPRPATNLVATNTPIQTPNSQQLATVVQQPAVNTQTTVSQVNAGASPAPAPTAPLAIAETQANQTPTANVIEQAAASPNVNTIAKPAPKPATTVQTQNNVEVASLSPTVEAAPSVQITETAPAPKAAKKQGFFEKLFAPKEPKVRPQATVDNPNKPKIQKPKRPASRIATANSVAERPSHSLIKPKVKKPKTVVASARTTSNRNAAALPGVKSNSEIFGIKDEGTSASKKVKTTQVAAVGSFGRLSPNGLRVQHSKVQVACLKPGVLRILKMVERRYGKKPIITSGYRSPKGNRRAGGARNSQHIFCKAVDIQVEGVSKWKLAKYLRTVPGRGGVGTYCRTKSVHFDIGSKRDWHHPCRKSSKRKRKKA